ncbi:mitochondrial intermediate peptidase [Ditylenchus destructor]|uniref:Mitochondrial intermediate peptidase n=1 Tax=Ditylenchus destructor TaxID=166010 RepID=A0AAD4MR93_9BILA|nr:mitochondrial intermediate peptidase [Ditylenchus destructor]
MKIKFPLRGIGRALEAGRNQTSTGLFGNPLLSSPRGFDQLASQVEQKSMALVQQIIEKDMRPSRTENLASPSTKTTVAMVDDLSNEICCGADLTECTRSMHCDPAFGEAAERSMRKYTGLVETITRHYPPVSRQSRGASLLIGLLNTTETQHFSISFNIECFWKGSFPSPITYGSRDRGFYTKIYVGSPPQQFNVKVDLWMETKIFLVDSASQLVGIDDFYGTLLSRKHRFNTSASSSFELISKYSSQPELCRQSETSDKDESDSDELPKRAKTLPIYRTTFSEGSDLVSLGSYGTIDPARLKMIVVNGTSEWFLYEPFDGILGLASQDNQNFDNSQDTIRAIGREFGYTKWTLWFNMNALGNGVSKLTFGDLDTKHCTLDTWKWVPRANRSSEWSYVSLTWNGWDWNEVPLHSIKTEGRPPKLVKRKLSIENKEGDIQVTNDLLEFFTEPNMAKKQRGKHVVDCNLTKAADVIFIIGDEFNPVELVLKGDDYITYDKDADACVLALFVLSSENPYTPIELPRRFLRNHCIAYDFEKDSIGFADYNKYFFRDM